MAFVPHTKEFRTILYMCLVTKTWKSGVSQNVANRRLGHSSTFDPVKNVLYVYGGCKNKRWFKDVNTLDIDTWKWTNIKVHDCIFSLLCQMIVSMSNM